MDEGAKKLSSCVVYEVWQAPFWVRTSKLIQNSRVFSTARNPTLVFSEQPLVELQTSPPLLSYDTETCLKLLFVIIFFILLFRFKKCKNKSRNTPINIYLILKKKQTQKTTTNHQIDSRNK